MAEREIVGAEVGRKPDSNLIKVEGTKKGLRIGALVCWMLVIVMEVMFLGFIFWDKCSWMEQNIGFILFLILDSALIVSASLPQGTYIVKVQTASSTTHHKLVKK